ncbi:hypothetical protein E2C01_053736 [Portunus trituberculatus]|uniref:Uncharacterized protein n=1 Tax=Portunus trituberculatus TaxID=210409 RepID=A0A5B7GQ07_PORTR|nr:hypothetical protein [Portunus trituberculatus]
MVYSYAYLLSTASNIQKAALFYIWRTYQSQNILTIFRRLNENCQKKARRKHSGHKLARSKLNISTGSFSPVPCHLFTFNCPEGSVFHLSHAISSRSTVPCH